jgi:hypothetical protein
MKSGFPVVLQLKNSIDHMCLVVWSIFLMQPCRTDTNSQNGRHELVLECSLDSQLCIHSQVPLVMNVDAGKISPQFRVIFDDKFETVLSMALGDSIDDQWKSIFHLKRECFEDVDF